MIRRAVLAGVVFLAACGAIAPDSDGGSGDGGIGVDAGATAWTQCTSPDNIAVCGGPNNCQPTTPDRCNCGFMGDTDTLGFCWGGGYHVPIDGNPCDPGPFGFLCIQGLLAPGTAGYLIADYNLGVLFAQNGAAARVRYADLSLWTGNPIPEPSTCPSLGPNVQPCGGSCGTCPTGEKCFGGSPIHPVGYCAPAGDCSVTSACNAGQSCFTFVVQPDAQADADQTGTCLASSDCDLLAQNLPGGGKCTPSP